MIPIRQAFEKKVKVKHGTKVADTIVGVPGDRYSLYFFGKGSVTLAGFELVTPISNETWVTAWEKSKISPSVLT